MDQIISNSARTSFFNNELVVTVVLDYLVTLLLYYLPTFLPYYYGGRNIWSFDLGSLAFGLGSLGNGMHVI